MEEVDKGCLMFRMGLSIKGKGSILDYRALGSGADPGPWQLACRWCES